MGRNNKGYVPKSFETIERVPGCKSYASIYIPMLQSRAYKRLSNRARTLYTFMKAQYRGAKNISEHTDQEFYFNWSMASTVYGLYTNKKAFYDDIKSLIENGFIEVVENGKTTRTRSIYRYSDKWKSIT